MLSVYSYIYTCFSICIHPMVHEGNSKWCCMVVNILVLYHGSSYRVTREKQSICRIKFLPVLSWRRRFKCIEYIWKDVKWAETLLPKIRKISPSFRPQAWSLFIQFSTQNYLIWRNKKELHYHPLAFGPTLHVW